MKARFLLAVSLAAHCAPANTGTPTADLQILVYNMHAGRDDQGVDNLARVADVIRESGADLVLLQEVDRGTERAGGRDQLAELEQATRLHGVFGRTLDFQGGEYGIAILSRWPDMAQVTHALPVTPAQERAGHSYEPRGALQAAVSTPYRVVYLLNTHLDPSPEDTYRLQEAKRVKAIADGLRKAGNTVVIGGDFNSLPDTPTIRLIDSGEFRDSWLGCGMGDGEGYPARDPVKRIDYLFISSDLECMGARVITSNASDHRPVLFSIRFRDR